MVCVQVRAREPLQLTACHPLYADFFAACALKESSWKLPMLPWQLPSHWLPVLQLGGQAGDDFWRGVLIATPAPEAERVARTATVAIREFAATAPTGSTERSTSLAALAGLSRVTLTGPFRATLLDWSAMRLDPAGVDALCTPLRPGPHHGGPNAPHAAVCKLHLHDNALLGAAGVATVMRTLHVGALPRLSVLRLSCCGLGDAGLSAIAQGLSKGGLEGLTELYLNENGIGDPGVIALSAALNPTDTRPLGALAKCEVLAFADNVIERDGILALAEACKAGALAQMKRFLIASNPKATAGPVVKALHEAAEARAKAKAAGGSGALDGPKNISEADLQSLFFACDPDNSGTIQGDELVKHFDSIGRAVTGGKKAKGDAQNKAVSTERIDELFAECDVNGSGSLTFDEFKLLVVKMERQAARESEEGGA